MPEPAQRKPTSLTHLRRRTVVGLLRTWRGLAHSARVALGREINPSLPKEDLEYLKKRMHECLDAKGGEVSARARTVGLGHVYLELNETGRERFLRLLATEFALDETRLGKAIDAYQKTSSTSSAKAQQGLRDALVTPRSIILRQLSALPDGFKFLVNLRADLLPLIGEDAALAALESDLKAILTAWFDVGLLDLVEINWNSPAALLEKVIAYEAVHSIRSWEDLKNRVDADRRIYAFLHNKMPLEPLIFVQVALVKGLADSVQVILDESQPVIDIVEADTAIFYSISNAQKGLAGIPFGNFLIKRVVEKLGREMPRIRHFSTLSPVPGFMAWLAKQDKPLYDTLQGDWWKSKEAQTHKPALMQACARYLAHEKKNGKALDPVAHFHLSNGARLERINWMGDTSPKGLKQSAGIMVNYYYALEAIDENHEDYVTEGKVAASRGVSQLAKQAV